MPNAPKVFISYSHDSPEHMDRVLALSNRLREGGIDCQIDQYEESPAKGWPQWCADQVEEAQFVLVACTDTYLRRFKGREEVAIGLGGTWEGHIITQELYNAQGKNTKFIPIIFSTQDAAYVPVTLQGATRYDLRATDGYESLYRRLTAQPKIKAPPIGPLAAMPARADLPSLPKLERKKDFLPWNVPHARNPFFTGREKVLEALQEALKRRGAAALTGLGGVGKTQTAVEYAYRHRQEYESVFWTKAESRDTLNSDFASIAAVLNLPESTAKEQEAAVSSVKRWLATHTGWLLVLDNADELGMVREFIPLDAKGHLLLTTRAWATAAVAERVEIAAMEPAEGAIFLLRRAGVIAKVGALCAPNEADRRLAAQISHELGGLPLALDQAGAFVEQTPSSLVEYFGFYRSQGAKLRAERGELGDHPSVTITFSLAFQKVATSSPAVADLIRVCACLAPDAIPEEIFTEGAAELGENLARVAANPLDFAQALKEAGRFSLINRSPQKKTLDIHRLVQAVVNDGQDEAEQRRWAERAVHAVKRAFPSVEFPRWTQCERLLPHAQACAALIERWDFTFQEAARLLNQAGYYLDDRARYSEAEPLYQRARAIWEKALGPEHPDVATSLNNLAELYRAQGKYDEAEPLHQRARAIWEKALGPEHPDVATSLNNLALLYDAQGRYDEAEPLYQRALGIREKTLGPEHPHVAGSLNNLALLYDAQGRYDEAEPLYQRALAIREKALGPEHPDVAQSLNNLAVLYYARGKYEEAEPLYQRALAMREKALGPEHPNVAISLNNLAELYRVQGKYDKAEPLFQRALAVWEKALGPEHPNVATSLNNLAELYRAQGKYEEAEPLYQRALAICEKALGPEHPDVAQSLNNLAALYRAQGNYGEAESLYGRALAILEKALGPDHPDVAIVLENYSVLLKEIGGEARAASMESRAAAIRAKHTPGPRQG